MMKKFALVAVAAAALGCASAAHAGYYETFNNFRGSFVIKNFEDGDKKFDVSLTGLDGAVSLQIPAAGTYGASIAQGSSLLIDYDGIPGADFGIASLPAALPIGAGTISSISGLPGVKSMEFNFDDVGSSTFNLNLAGGIVAPVAPGTTRAVAISGSGATSLFAALLGIPGFLTGNVSGIMGVNITFNQDRLDFLIDGSGLTGTNLEAVLDTLDNGGLNDGKIDGTFRVNGSVHIPEPGSLALLGLGLVGLAAHRRKALKTRKAA
jgi:hypothetical protein